MNLRWSKQLIIGSVYLVIFIVLGYGIYNWTRVKPTCFDGIQNGKEEGVDCGTLACGKPCGPVIQPIQINNTKLIKVIEGDYDFIAQVSNPNTDYGSSVVTYVLTHTDANGQKTSEEGNFYILPGQTRYLVRNALKSLTEISEMTLEVKSVDWEKVNMPGGGISFAVQGKDLKNINKGSVAVRVAGVLLNDSNYDFDTVDIVVVVFDSQADIIGVNKTDIRTFLAHTSRGFTVEWPSPFKADAYRIDIEASTNLFNNSNFIKDYGTQERFQQYY